MRSVVCLVFITLVGCSGQPPAPSDPAHSRRTLIAHASQLRQATIQPDHDLMTRLTHPAVVQGMGGEARFKEQLAEIVADMNRKGFGITDLILGEPSELVEGRGKLYAVVPDEIRLSGPEGASGVKPSFLIGESADGGNTWKFIDGAGVAGDRAKLRRVLPDFPDSLALPPLQEAVWRN